MFSDSWIKKQFYIIFHLNRVLVMLLPDCFRFLIIFNLPLVHVGHRNPQIVNNFGLKLENNLQRIGSFNTDNQKEGKFNCENAKDDQETDSKIFQLHRTINFTSFIKVNNHKDFRLLFILFVSVKWWWENWKYYERLLLSDGININWQSCILILIF